MVSEGGGDGKKGTKRKGDDDRSSGESSKKKKTGRPRNKPLPPAPEFPVQILPRPTPNTYPIGGGRDNAAAEGQARATINPSTYRSEAVPNGHGLPLIHTTHTATYSAILAAQAAPAAGTTFTAPLTHERVSIVSQAAEVYPTPRIVPQPIQPTTIRTGRSRGMPPIDPSRLAPNEHCFDLTVLGGPGRGKVTFENAIYCPDYPGSFFNPRYLPLLGLPSVPMDRSEIRIKITPRGPIRATQKICLNFWITHLEDTNMRPRQLCLSVLNMGDPNINVPLIIGSPQISEILPNVLAPGLGPELGFSQGEQNQMLVPNSNITFTEPPSVPFGPLGFGPSIVDPNINGATDFGQIDAYADGYANGGFEPSLSSE